MKKESLTSTMKRTSDHEWSFSEEIPSDIVVRVGSTSFPLHKFPLVSKCGYFRKLVLEATNGDLREAEISALPGGAEAFELVAKFCYGITIEISIDNIAIVRCVGEFLEMTEKYTIGNLIGRAETYLSEVALESLSASILVLHASENLLPIAEDVMLVSRCIDAIAYLASCNDTQQSSSLFGNGLSNIALGTTQLKQLMDYWWAEDLSLLKIDFFKRVIIAMMERGFNQCDLGPVLMMYARKSLSGLDMFGKEKRKSSDPREEDEKRIVLETIVCLLPKEKNALSVSFLAMLLRASIYLETTISCRLELERRMALQLGQAVLSDLLIPSCSFARESTLFDVDTVRRIMMNYNEYVTEGNCVDFGIEEEYIYPSQSDLERVGKLMESYLVETAADPNLTVEIFIDFVEVIPQQSRVIEDGVYRAIDIFLKAHPDASEMERKKVCSSMDCEKLSREACAHVAQNNRLPVQIVVQVLYYEQQRLYNAMNSNNESSHSISTTTSTKKGLPIFSAIDHSDPVFNELVILRQENENLKKELVKTNMKLIEMERSTSNQVGIVSSSNNSPSSTNPLKSFMNSMSKKLGRLFPLMKGDTIDPPKAKDRKKPARVRRHSIS